MRATLRQHVPATRGIRGQMEPTHHILHKYRLGPQVLGRRRPIWYPANLFTSTATSDRPQLPPNGCGGGDISPP